MDILQYIKNNWPLILVLIGLGGAYIAKFIKL